MTEKQGFMTALYERLSRDDELNGESNSMGITSPYPRENIIAGNYILADTQAFLSKRNRQQNKEILIKHSPGIGECFLFLNIQLTEK